MKARSYLPRTATSLAVQISLLLYTAFASAQPAPTPPAGAQPGGPAARQVNPAGQKANQQFSAAAKLQKANRLKEAVEGYKQYIATVRASSLPPAATLPAYQNLAAIYRTQGKAAELEDALTHMSALAAGNAATHAELATLYASPSLQKFDRAAKEARLALTLKPSPGVAAAAHAALGIAAVSHKDYVAAESEFGAATKLFPNNAQLLYNYGLALTQRKKFAAALTVMQRAAAANKNMAGAYYYIGILDEEQQKYPEAIQAFRQAVHLAPTDPSIHFDLARVLVRQNAIEDAITSYLVVLELAPQSLPARLAVAQLYLRLNNYSAARVHFTQAVRLAPRNTAALTGLAECETELAMRPQDTAGRTALLKQAEEHYRTAAGVDPRLLSGPFSLAHFYERTGSFEKAQEIYRKRVEADPKDFVNVNLFAQTYLMQRKPDEAIAIWRKFRDQHPENPAPYARIAETLETQSRFPEAVSEWQKLLTQKLQPGAEAGVRLALGKDYQRAGLKKEAADMLESVLKLDPTAAAAPRETRIAAAATVQSERIEAMQELARTAERDNNLEEAIRWQQQIKADEAAAAERAHTAPNAQTYIALARLYQRAKKPDLAIKELDSTAQSRQARGENLAAVYEELAQVYEAQSRFDDAVIAYRRSSALSKDPLNALLRVAEVYQRSKRLNLAIAELEAMRRDNPREAKVLAPLALAYRQAGQDDQALKVYDALLAADPRAGWARDQRAAVLTHMRRFDEARAEYENQLAQNPDNRQLYADIAYVFQAEGRPDAFLDWAAPRLAKTPANQTLMAVIVDEAVRQKKEDQGWSLIRAAAEQHKTRRAVVEAAAGFMNQRSKREDALALYRLVASQYPNDLSAQITVADQLFAAGHKEEASRLYMSLIDKPGLGPAERLSVRRQFARCCAEQGNSAEALAQLQEIYKADPNDFDSATRLALLLESSGRDVEAIPVLQSLATREIYPAQVRAQIRSKIGRLYLKKGDKSEAAAQFRAALELDPKDSTAQDGLKQTGVK